MHMTFLRIFTLECRWLHVDKTYTKYALSWCVNREEPVAGKRVPGGDFVDATLKVVVRNAPNSMFLFKPEYPHGTTVLDGLTKQHHITLAFTQGLANRVRLAHAAAYEGGDVLAFRHWDRAGEGNIDNENDGREDEDIDSEVEVDTMVSI